MTACKSNLKNIATALEMYSTDYEGLYPPSTRQLTPNYLVVIPVCPAAGKETYSGSYRVGREPDFYQLHCQGENHESVSVEGPYPAYDSVTGLAERRDSY